MPRRKGRRRKRSPLVPVLALFAAGVGCIIVAGAVWLWSPETGGGGPLPGRVAQRPSALPPVTAAPEPILSAPVPPSAAVPAASPSGLAAPTPTAAPSLAPPEPSSSAPLAAPTFAPASAPPGVPGSARLAIIIDDCGQWPATERGFVALPFPVTLSVLPHVRYGATIAREANAAGKGVMLHLPMQTLSGRYPGPGTITTDMNDATIEAAVAGDLDALPEARGVNNHEGSRATADPRVMGDIADVLARDGRFWIDSRTSAASVAEEVARGRGVPTARRDVFLDNVDDVGSVEAQLREAAARARASGSAIAIGHPRPATLAAVRLLAPQLAADGIDLTLASDLVR